jgi:dipeptidyl aminopeptidase/acylaminoacyl peptidase
MTRATRRNTMVRENSSTKTKYRTPPKAIADLVDAPLTPDVSVSPNQDWILLMEQPPLPPISELAQPELKLAGLRINPRNNGPSRSSYYNDLTLKSLSNNSERPITGLPPDARIDNIYWSPDSSLIAFTHSSDSEIQLWLAEVNSGTAIRLTDARLNSAYRRAFRWLSDSRSIICRVIPSDRGSVPEEPEVPDGPVIQENTGKKAPARTYQDLLKNPYDEILLEHYLTTQIMIVSISGESTVIGSKGIIGQVEPSPDGCYILVEMVHSPFSYLVPIGRFPRRMEIWDMDGKIVHKVVDLPLAEEVPIDFDAVPTGPRSFSWRADVPATLYWAEAQDEGDPKVEADIRDKVFTLPQPFEQDPIPLASLGFRFSDVKWSSNNMALVSERWWKTRRTRTWIARPDSPEEEAQLLFDRSYEDRYSDPGNPLTRPTDAGTRVLLATDGGNTVFLAGEGASPEGNRPFLDKLDLTTLKTKRLWRSEAPYYESLVQLLDERSLRLLTRRESTSEPPNYFIRDLSENQIHQITAFPHPAPQLAEVHKELIRYERADGIKLTATLYLPPGYSPSDGPLPMLMWAYPREYKSADAAGQVTDSPYRFVRIHPHSPLFWLVQGYAILDNPTMPIVGEDDTQPNDTYVDQLVASAKAAVDEVVRRGVADRSRIAIGGHSYGAFMTANLLANSDLFAAGVGRSGAYNRSLTPFGFQAEERTFWEAPQVYFRMSPFMHADKVKKPILLIHGAEDNNAGTFPIQSERFYHALKGHGADVRLVMLPNESHGYRARESVMHMLWEMDQWLEKYVNVSAT